MILDIGCGKRKIGDIRIDFSKDSDANVIADIHHLPFREGIFDEVISSNVAEHSYNLKSFFCEQFRVLKDNGLVECVTDNASFVSWSFLKTNDHADMWENHYCIFYPKNIVRLLEMCGFSDLKSDWVDKRNRKVFYIFAFLIRLNLIRRDCLYQRFKVTGKKARE